MGDGGPADTTSSSRGQPSAVTASSSLSSGRQPRTHRPGQLSLQQHAQRDQRVGWLTSSGTTGTAGDGGAPATVPLATHHLQRKRPPLRCLLASSHRIGVQASSYCSSTASLTDGSAGCVYTQRATCHAESSTNAAKNCFQRCHKSHKLRQVACMRLIYALVPVQGQMTCTRPKTLVTSQECLCAAI